MRLYWEIGRRGFRRYATYRGATVAGLFTNVIFGFMRGYILLALIRERGPVGGLDESAALTYTWLTQGLLMIIFMWGWWEVAERVRTGDVVTDLYRPVDFVGYWLASDLGRACYHALSRGILPFVVGGLVFHLRTPDSVARWAGFGCSLFLAVVASFGFRFLLNASAFWLLDYKGPGRLGMIFSNFASGFIVPITLFPDWLETACRLTPFPSMLFVPIEVFMGRGSLASMTGALAVQAAWAVALLVASRVVLNSATRKLVVQGG